VIDRVITITGPPGSGKSTAGRGVAERLDLEFRSAGELFRERANTAGITLSEFSRRAEGDETIDRALDAQMLALARPGRVLEGRVTGALCRRRGVPCYYLLVTARPEIRYRRLAARDGISLGEAASTTTAREASERDRYLRYYGIDLDRETADLTVDSSELSVDAVVERLSEFVLAQVPPGTR
jgi:cytidylate kinase